MLLMKSLNGFQLHDDLVEADEVWLIKAAIAPLVADFQCFLGDKRYVSQRQLLFKCILVDLFKVASPKRFIDFVNSASDGVCLFFIDQITTIP